MEGARKQAKSNHPEATLRNGSKPNSGSVVNSQGLKQGSNDAPQADSNVETLRHGKAPKGESVRQAQHDSKAQKKAHGFNERSKKGGANPTAYPGM